MKTLPEWIKEIEIKRLEDEREEAEEQRQASAEYNAYISSYRSYSEEEMRDFEYTWGPGFEPEDKPVDELADYNKVQGPQLEILKKMIERNHPDEDINYIFLSKCGWDYDYPIDRLGEEYTYEDVLLRLVEEYRSEAKFYEEKVDKIEEKQGENNMYYLVKDTFDFDSDITVELLSRSKDKGKLQEEIKKIFLNAVNNEDVEFINDYYRTEIDVDDDEWDDNGNFSELSIVYAPGDFEDSREEYSIISDENALEL